MKTVTALDNQQLIDFAMQELGDVERLMELAVLNGMAITDPVRAGQQILIPDADTDKVNIIQAFAHPSAYPASGDDGFDDLTSTLPPGGIGYMQIGRNFIVS